MDQGRPTRRPVDTAGRQRTGTGAQRRQYMEVRRAKRNAETHEVVTLPGQWGRVLPLWSPWLLSVGGDSCRP